MVTSWNSFRFLFVKIDTALNLGSRGTFITSLKLEILILGGHFSDLMIVHESAKRRFIFLTKSRVIAIS